MKSKPKTHENGGRYQHKCGFREKLGHTTRAKTTWTLAPDADFVPEPDPVMVRLEASLKAIDGKYKLQL